ncbi:MAG TPA: tripartite tricarboxylate transporter TctB family protein [Candidatus Methylomirabilis sp.]|nr:tripartite tricarboxylate transporter TctB family protein [Candidatus Methylomirabilis sp.]
MRRADQITGVIVLIFSLVVIEGARRMPPSGTFGPGAGFLPFWLGAAMAVLAIILLVNASREPAHVSGRSPFPKGRRLLPILATVGALGGFILLLEILGFLLATALLTAFLLRVVEREGWWISVGVGLANAAGLYVVFQVLLGVSLPKTVFGF